MRAKPFARFSIPFLVALALTTPSCGSIGFPKAQDEGGKPWLRIESKQFDFITDSDERAARTSSAQIALWWQAMAQALPLVAPQTNPERLTVLAVRDHWESEAISQRILGFFRTFKIVGPFLYVGDPTDANGRSTLRHELAHAFVYERLGDTPQWFSEGMARYLQTAEFNESTSQIAWGAVGALEMNDYNQWGRNPLVEDLVDDDPWAASDVGEFTFQSGLLIHLLMNRHLDEFNAYVAALARRDFSDATFLRCFPSFTHWDSELRDYRYSFGFATKTAPAHIEHRSDDVWPASQADVHALLALVDTAMLGWTDPQYQAPRIVRANANMERALDLDETRPLVLAASVSCLTPADPVRIARLSNQMVAIHPTDWRAWRVRASLSALGQAERIQACDRAFDLAPDDLDERALLPCARIDTDDSPKTE